MMTGATLDGGRDQSAWVQSARTALPTMQAPPNRPAMSAEADARFRRMVDDEFALVWRFLRGLGVAPSAVDDAAQQVFLVAAQRIDAITLGSERAFLLA